VEVVAHGKSTTDERPPNAKTSRQLLSGTVKIAP
jgi:hypothetical protein